jgi:hypothetical protein
MKTIAFIGALQVNAIDTDLGPAVTLLKNPELPGKCRCGRVKCAAASNAVYPGPQT